MKSYLPDGILLIADREVSQNANKTQREAEVHLVNQEFLQIFKIDDTRGSQNEVIEHLIQDKILKLYYSPFSNDRGTPMPRIEND